jgi:uncharacterized membrane protein HdeD (DUF308 family)
MNDYSHVNPWIVQKIQENSAWYYTFGIVLILLGLVALSSTVGVTLASVLVFGALIFLGGLIEFIHAFWSRRLGDFFLALLAGILGMVIGGLMFVNPGLSALSLTLILGIYFIADGIFRTVIALVYRPVHYGWLIFNGLITLLLGIMVIAQWPYSGLWVIGLFIGIDLIVSGWTLIATAMLAKRAIHIRQ